LSHGAYVETRALEHFQPKACPGLDPGWTLVRRKKCDNSSAAARRKTTSSLPFLDAPAAEPGWVALANAAAID
jgi:hypothetical protein